MQQMYELYEMGAKHRAVPACGWCCDDGTAGSRYSTRAKFLEAWSATRNAFEVLWQGRHVGM